MDHFTCELDRAACRLRRMLEGPEESRTDRARLLDILGSLNPGMTLDTSITRAHRRRFTRLLGRASTYLYLDSQLLGRDLAGPPAWWVTDIAVALLTLLSDIHTAREIERSETGGARSAERRVGQECR